VFMLALASRIFVAVVDGFQFKVKPATFPFDASPSV
jgi:hypothetical protein